MKNKQIGTAIIAACTVAVTSGCGILETLETVQVPQLRFDSNSYVVQPGDTLDSVASRYKIDPDSLLNVNSLELAELIPGQRLLLLRDDEFSATTRNSSGTGITTSNSGESIGGSEVAGVGETVVLPIATQTVARVTPDPTVIGTDVVVPVREREEIVAVVNAEKSDALLDDQPIFVPAADTAPSAAPLPKPPVVRPQGVETIVKTVNADGSTVASPSSPVPTAATVEIADAESTPTKRVTVNTRAKGWNWPVLGTITQDFDLREINRQGLDIDPGADAAVQAAADGEVVYSGRDLASYGNLVILRHENNFLSAYSKVSEIFVEENQKVKAGDLIASVGENESGNHEMHFEIRQNGEPVNPVDYLPAL